MSTSTTVPATVPRNVHGAPYQSDIDGLRAVAVVLVVIFHLGGAHNHPAIVFPGGFIGVDVFFVISGYLLTGIIERDIAACKFSIAGFYERRVRRILPALMGLLVFTTLAGLFLLLPLELVAYARSLVAAVLSYSNFYFWSVSSYFDAPGAKPLLHTWSLAVEEQFYLVLPMLLLLLAKYPRRLKVAVLVALCCASFAFSAWEAHALPTASFYSPLSRAWELLVGSLLALGVIPELPNRVIREAVAAAGAGMILYAACWLSATSPFPGVNALFPCLGSAFILVAGRSGECTIGLILSWRPVAFIGLISFSVYLWHWPLIVFSTMGLLPIPTHGLYFPAMMLISLAAGALSWHYIEKPFRTGRFRSVPRAKVFRVALTCMALFASTAGAIIGLNGLAWRYPIAATRIAAITYTNEGSQSGTCYVDSFAQFRKDICMRVDPRKHNYVLLGDSHSAALWYGLSRALSRSHVLQASFTGCSLRIGLSGDGSCAKLAAYVFEDFLATHKVDGVLLSDHWRYESDFTSLAKTAEWCRSRHIPVYVVGPVMEYNAPLPRLLAYAISFHDGNIVQRAAETEFFSLDARFARIAVDQWHVHYLSLINVECPHGRCMTYVDASHTTPMLSDDNHLSNGASFFVMKKLVDDRALPD